MSATTVDKFLRDLRKSNLLSAEILEAAWIENASDPNDLARKLVEMNLLTAWQSQMLLAGRNAFFLGKYKLLDQLGEGGMGTVFKAEQVPLGRIVAVKVMARKLVNNPESVVRFQREIQTAAALNHPNIVLAFDADCFHDTHFLVMEYIEGEDLGSLAKRRKQLPIGEACEYVRQAALGLQHAFEKGMVHRDIKPSNLLLKVESRGSRDESKSSHSQHASLNAQPVVKILDMGLAKFESESTEEGSLTSTGQIMGTPDYIAPEQAQNSKNADIRSDIYSLGCTLFRLLTGDLPFKGDNAIARIMARALNDAPEVQSLRPEIPDSLNAVVAGMLSRNPERRYQSPREVAEAMAPFAELPTASQQRRSVVDDKQVKAAVPVIPELEEFLNQLATEAAVEEGTDTSSFQIGETLEKYENDPADGKRHAGDSTKESDRSRSKTKTRISRAGKKLQQDLQQRKQAERKRMLLLIAGLLAFLAFVGGLWGWHKAGETLLVIDWPENERQEATLVIDGEAISLKADTKLNFSGRSGNRELRLTRKGYESIEQTLNFARGETKTIRPEWQPTPESIRKRQMVTLERRIGETLNSEIPNPKSAIAELRDELIEFRRKHAGTAESLGAARLMSRFRWPVDQLKKEDIDPYELRIAGEGDPAKASKELVAVLGDSRLRHWGGVSSLAFSPDGQTLASASGDHTIKLWDPTTGEEIRTLRGHDGPVFSAAFSPDGQWLACSGDKTIKVWNVATGEETLTLRGHTAGVTTVAFSPDGQRLASGSIDKTIKLWDAATGRETLTLKAGVAGVTSVVFRSDGETLAWASGSIVTFSDVATGREKVTYTGASGGVASIAFSPDGQLLATRGSAGTIALLDVNTGTEQVTLRGHDRAPFSVAFSPDGSLLASSGADRLLKLWDVKSGSVKLTLTKHSVPTHLVAFSPDGKTLASGGVRGRIQLWDVETGEEKIKPAGHQGAVDSVAVSPNGRWIASAGSWNDTAIKLWDTATGQEAFTKRHFTGTFNVAFSPDGKTLATVSANWDFKTGQQLYRLQGHTDEVLCIAFSPDGKTLATGANLHDKTVKLRDAATGRERSTLSGHTSSIHSVAFSPDGKMLASGSLRIKVWNVATGRETLTLGGVTSVAFSPDGEWLAGGSQYQTIKLWDPATGRDPLLLTLKGHIGDVTSVAFSPDDGKRLASAGIDGTVRLWEIQSKRLQDSTNTWLSGKLLRTFQLGPPGGEVNQVAFTPDGRHLVTANGNGTIYILRLEEWADGREWKNE